MTIEDGDSQPPGVENSSRALRIIAVGPLEQDRFHKITHPDKPVGSIELISTTDACASWHSVLATVYDLGVRSPYHTSNEEDFYHFSTIVDDTKMNITVLKDRFGSDSFAFRYKKSLQNRVSFVVNFSRSRIDVIFDKKPINEIDVNILKKPAEFWTNFITYVIEKTEEHIQELSKDQEEILQAFAHTKRGHIQIQSGQLSELMIQQFEGLTPTVEQVLRAYWKIWGEELDPILAEKLRQQIRMRDAEAQDRFKSDM